MTLIQTLITDDLIIQVADRRLTNAATGMLVDDQYTKLVCWNFNFSIGFTGLARIDRAQRRSTSEWIAETICDYGLFEDGVAALARVASERVGKLPKAWPDKRLGILVAGFDAAPTRWSPRSPTLRLAAPCPGTPRISPSSELAGYRGGLWVTGSPELD